MIMEDTDSSALNATGNSTDIGEYGPFPVPWYFWFNTIATPIIVLVGIVGNSLSLIVMKSKALRHKSYSHYLCALAVFDTLTLLVTLLSTVNNYLIDHEHAPGLFYNFNNLGCKLYNFLAHVCTLMSAWIVVLMAVERLLAVCVPFRKVWLRKQSGAAIAICTSLVLACGSQSFRIIMVEHVEYSVGPSVTKDCMSGNDYTLMYTGLHVYYYNWTLLFALPVFIILLCNTLVLRQILNVRKEFNKGANSRVNRAVRTKHRSTFMLLVVTFAYILTLLPMFLLSFIIDLNIQLQPPEVAGPIYVALMPYLKVSECIAMLNYAMNFFIYVLSGKSFRFELRRRFNCTQRLKRNTTVRTTRSTREEFLRLQ